MRPLCAAAVLLAVAVLLTPVAWPGQAKNADTPRDARPAATTALPNVGEPGGQDPVQAKTVWEGEIRQGAESFPTNLYVLERDQDRIKGEIHFKTRDRLCKLTFQGNVVDGRTAAWITDKKEGDPTAPGLYVGKITGDSIAGVWQVPSAGQYDRFTLRLQGEAAKKDLDPLQGTWKLLNHEEDGKDVPHDDTQFVTFDKNKVTWKRRGEVIEEGTIELDSTKAPRHLDYHFTSGRDDQTIYIRTGDYLVQCGRRDGKTRPTEFATATPSGGEYLIVLRREPAAPAKDGVPGAPGKATAANLTGDWVYGGNKEGKCQIRQDKDAVTLELTYTPAAAVSPAPHYRVQATLAGRVLKGTWEYVSTFEGFKGHKGAFYAEVGADGDTITVSETEQPDERHAWNTVVLTRPREAPPR